MDKTKYKKELKRLKEIQNTLNNSKSCTKNPNWKKQWLPFIKYDQDWGNEYFLNIILYKLEKIFVEIKLYSDEEENSLNKKLIELKKIIDIGWRIHDDKYFDSVFSFSDDHNTKIVGILDKNTKKEIFAVERKIDSDSIAFQMYDKVQKYIKTNKVKDYIIFSSGKWDDEENYKIWKSMRIEAEKQRKKDISLFFKSIGNAYDDLWC